MEEEFRMHGMKRTAQFGLIAASLTLVIGIQTVSAQIVDVDAGYLDTFNLTDGRVIDVGELGGGVIGDPNQHKIFVTPQNTIPSPPLPVDGRLTGTVHGKLRVVFLTDRTGDGFINGSDLDNAFDVSWQVVGFDKTQGNASAAFVPSVVIGPEGTVATHAPSVNIPPTPGGTASVWNISTCAAGGFGPNTGNTFCNQFAITSATPYTGFVDYTFPVSIPYSNDFTPGLQISNLNWILAALVGNTGEAQPPGAIAYGTTAAYDPINAINESNTDLFGPNLLLTFPGETANVNKANLLTSVQINVTPEPASLCMLALGALVGLRRKR
jgi:hypothetical protein